MNEKMITMSLARLLKYKNRLVEEIGVVKRNIASNNSHIEGETVEVSVKDEVKRLNLLIQHLLQVKMTLFNANKSIQQHIFEIAELKGLISMYETLNTTHGVQPSRYRDEQSITYVAVIRKTEADTVCRDLKAKMDRLQDEIEAYNYSTKVEIPNIGVSMQF